MKLHKFKGTYKQRIALVEKYLKDEISLNGGAKEAKVNLTTFRNWVGIYQAEGPEGLKNNNNAKRYPKKLKLQAVWDYKEGKGSLNEITKKYGIRSRNSLPGWVKTYNTYGDFKRESSEKKTMSKSRKTTQEEREKIVKDCLAHDKDYNGMVAKYQVSYANLYNWVKKYEEMGPKGLEDRRGHRKGSLPSRTPIEQIEIEKEELKRHNEYLQMEVDILKKLKELEGRNH